MPQAQGKSVVGGVRGAESSYRLAAYEASIILPAWVEKLGHNNQLLRVSVRSGMKLARALGSRPQRAGGGGSKAYLQGARGAGGRLAPRPQWVGKGAWREHHASALPRGQESYIAR